MCSADWMVMGSMLAGRDGHIFIPYRCGRKFCPRCVKEWSQKLSTRLMAPAAKAGPKRLRHLVLTIPNPPIGELAHGLDELQHCFREWRNQGRRKAHGHFWHQQSGYAAKLEIEYSTAKGWHPHVHILLDCKRGFDFRRNSDARRAWERITEHRLGKPAVANWISNGRDVDVVREVAKYCSKPLTLHTLGIPELIESAAALHRRRIHTSQGTLHAPEPDDSGGGYVYLCRLSELFGNTLLAAGSGLDVDAIFREFRQAHKGDQRIMERVPALRGLLETDPTEDEHSPPAMPAPEKVQRSNR